MKQYILKSMFVLLIVWAGGVSVQAQYGFGTNSPNPSSVMDVVSTNKGFLPPRMPSLQIPKILTPEEGMIVYNTNQHCLMYYAKGAFTCSDVPPPPAPLAYNVAVVAGYVQLGASLNASYNYAQYSGIAEGTSAFQWYYATDAKGTSPKALSATTRACTLASPVAVGNYVAVGVTPVTAMGVAGLQVLSPWREVIPNFPPYYDKGTISFALASNNQIVTATSSFSGTYSDKENDQQASQVYKWYRYKDAACATTPTVVATGANTTSYTFTLADTTCYIKVGVSPVAKTGTVLGTETLSSAYGPVWICGAKLKVNHDTSDGVSAEKKTVYYETVITNIGSPPANDGTVVKKCWTTRNLGAENLPKSATDNSLASSGWYWQFGYKLGHKNDGTTTTGKWQKNSSGMRDWKTAENPCTILLGSKWRIPTISEWTTANNTWSDNNGAWSSVFLLHAAGWLDNNTAKIGSSRGSIGTFWTSNYTQNGIKAKMLYIKGKIHGVGTDLQNYGCSVRCVLDD